MAGPSPSSEAASRSESSTGFDQMMQQLAAMAAQQQALNDAMQKMPGEGNPTLGQMDLLSQLAAQQQALGEAMRQLAGQMGQTRDVLGRLDDLADEMEQAAEELARGETGPRLRDRQGRILKRLLDAQPHKYGNVSVGGGGPCLRDGRCCVGRG